MGMAGGLTHGKWALVLGCSSGIGAGIARALASSGYGIFGVHLDLADRLEQVEHMRRDLERRDVPAVFFNVNAASETAQAEVIARAREITRGAGIHVLVHSLAFGALAPLVRFGGQGDVVHRRQLDMTLAVMAHSLVYWVQGLLDADLLGRGARIFAMTSAGSTKVTRGYGAVSAAKCALESHVRQLALELAPHGIAVNAIRAGVTDTPAMRKIPGASAIVERVLASNPFHRLTTPEDVGSIVTALADHASAWMTGNVLGADGGELNTT
jgi:NAD(P)-dependent dehydrogenase (short-subunit alcohol dehydrogenase family)